MTEPTTRITLETRKEGGVDVAMEITLSNSENMRFSLTVPADTERTLVQLQKLVLRTAKERIEEMLSALSTPGR